MYREISSDLMIDRLRAFVASSKMYELFVIVISSSISSCMDNLLCPFEWTSFHVALVQERIAR